LEREVFKAKQKETVESKKKPKEEIQSLLADLAKTSGVGLNIFLLKYDALLVTPTDDKLQKLRYSVGRLL
jgi:SUMO ligase MMS21 Smc5/6 complex component